MKMCVYRVAGARVCGCRELGGVETRVSDLSVIPGADSAPGGSSNPRVYIACNRLYCVVIADCLFASYIYTRCSR